MKKNEFIIQCIDKQITSANTHELKEQLDNDYSHLVGISISDTYCSTKAVLEQVKVKGADILPSDFEAVHIMTSRNVEPNKRFYTLFEAVETQGDEIVVRFKDSLYSSNYNLQIHLLLTNNPENINRGILR